MRRCITAVLLFATAGCREFRQPICVEDPTSSACASAADAADDSAESSSDGASDGAADADASEDAAADTNDATEGDVDATDGDADDALDASDASDATDAVPDTTTCVADAYACTDATLKKCDPDGKGWSDVVTCPSAATCDASLKRCTACSPGTYSCTGSDRYSCSSLGTPSKVATCLTPELCTASTGATCMAAVCAPGEKRCAPGGKNVETCNAGRTGWTTLSTCAIGCAASACLMVEQIAGSGYGDHFCVRLSDGTVRCWGGNGAGQVDGIGAVAILRKPTIVSGVSSATDLAAGGITSGVVLTDATVKLWGYLPGVDLAKQKPTTVPGLSTVSDLTIGVWFACAIVSGGNVRCWGNGASGQLGSGGISDYTPPAFASPSVAGATAVFAGQDNAFALVALNAKAWGDNSDGHLGAGPSAPTTAWSPVSSFLGVSQVAAGLAHTCARKVDGTVVCAGSNSDGQLGNASVTTSSSDGVAVTGLSGVVSVASGHQSSCAATSAGKVSCWGDNANGSLGSGTATASKTPLEVPGVTNAIEVVASSYTFCALMTDRTLIKCWGPNDKGQLGANLDPATTTKSTSPVNVVW